MQSFQQWLATINAFIEDTCVVFTVAYFLSRARFIQQPGTDRRRVASGIALGIVAATEVVFSTMRAPYMSHTLVVCLAILIGGWLTASTVILVVVSIALFFSSAAVAFQVGILLLLASAVTYGSYRFGANLRQPLLAGVAGGASQAIAILGVDWFDTIFHPLNQVPLWLGSIPANAFGLFLVMLVFQDSEVRSRSERHRLEAEHLKTLLVAADLAALRARIRPHFLFNTLTAIASLCGIDPARAEESVLKLGRIMRRTIEVDPSSVTMLSSEIDYVQSYMDIQGLRFGKRVEARLDIDPRVLGTNLPAFALQTLVENAYQHGISGSSEKAGTVSIEGRLADRRNQVILAVKDNGVGMECSGRSANHDPGEPPRHGLDLVDRQLRLLYGNRSRLRIFGKTGKGTLVVFQVPGTPL